MKQEQIHLEDSTEIGLNKGVGYRCVTGEWYPLHRECAVDGWRLYKTNYGLPTFVHFSTREAAINYLKGR